MDNGLINRFLCMIKSHRLISEESWDIAVMCCFRFYKFSKYSYKEVNNFLENV